MMGLSTLSTLSRRRDPQNTSLAIFLPAAAVSCIIHVPGTVGLPERLREPQPAAFVSIAGTSLKLALLEVHLGAVRGW